MKKLVLSSAKMAEFLMKNEREAKDLYHAKGFTARQLASHFGIYFNANFQKKCYEVLGSKGMGLGGARVGSGNFSVEKKKPPKKGNIFVFDFSDDVTQIINKSTSNGYSNYKNFVSEAILFFEKRNEGKVRVNTIKFFVSSKYPNKPNEVYLTFPPEYVNLAAIQALMTEKNGCLVSFIEYEPEDNYDFAKSLVNEGKETNFHIVKVVQKNSYQEALTEYRTMWI